MENTWAGTGIFDRSSIAALALHDCCTCVARLPPSRRGLCKTGLPPQQPSEIGTAILPDDDADEIQGVPFSDSIGPKIGIDFRKA